MLKKLQICHKLLGIQTALVQSTQKPCSKGFAEVSMQFRCSAAYPNANTLIKDLSDIGLLQEITGQKRNRAFSYEPYLTVFRDS